MTPPVVCEGSQTSSVLLTPPLVHEWSLSAGVLAGYSSMGLWGELVSASAIGDSYSLESELFGDSLSLLMGRGWIHCLVSSLEAFCGGGSRLPQDR